MADRILMGAYGDFTPLYFSPDDFKGVALIKFTLKIIIMDSIADDTLDPPNQRPLTDKSSVTDQLDAPNEAWEQQTDRAFHIGATLKGIPGYNHGGLND